MRIASRAEQGEGAGLVVMGRKVLGYVGVDPSLRGTAIVATRDKDTEVRRVKVAGEEGKADRLSAFMDTFEEEIGHVIRWATGRVDVALVEGYAFGAVGNALTLQAEVGGIVRAVLARHWPVIEVPVGTWRALTINRFGIVAGKGAKAREQKYLAEVERWFGFRAESTHEAEARLICAAAESALNETAKLTEGGKKLRDALLAVWHSTINGRR